MKMKRLLNSSLRWLSNLRNSRFSAALPPSIVVSGTSFGIQKSGRTVDFQLTDVTEVVFYKHDELTTDLVCCDMTVGSGSDARVWTLHEEMPGFEDLLTLFGQLDGFRKDWRDAVIQPAFAENRTVVFTRKTTGTMP